MLILLAMINEMAIYNMNSSSFDQYLLPNLDSNDYLKKIPAFTTYCPGSALVPTGFNVERQFFW